MIIRFVLIREGKSDDGLIPHLEQLCIAAGADKASGFAPDLSRSRVGLTLIDKINYIIQKEPNANLFFLHRDADSRDSASRHEEIRQATIFCALTKKWIAVVPVQETEAWLLLDEKAIRAVAGKPSGRTPLDLPRPKSVENLARPKEILIEKLSIAAELTGRRYKRFIADFPNKRKLLLNRLPIDGPLLQVPSWRKMKNSIEEVIQSMHGEIESTLEYNKRQNSIYRENNFSV